MDSFPFRAHISTQKLDLIRSLPDAARLSCFTGPSPDGKRFYGVDLSHRLPSGETEPCIVELERRWDSFVERQVLRFPNEYFPVRHLERSDVSEYVAGFRDASAIESVNYLTCGIMPLLGFVVVACCGDFTEESGAVVLFRPYANEAACGDCFPIKLWTPASTWSACTAAHTPLLAYGSNAHTVNVFEFGLADSSQFRLDQILADYCEPDESQHANPQERRTDGLPIESILAISSLPYFAPELRIRSCVLVQHAHNIPFVSFRTENFGTNLVNTELLASVSLDCTAHWMVLSTADWATNTPSQSSGLRLRTSLGSGGMQRDGGWFILPLPWRFWHAGAPVIISPEDPADQVYQRSAQRQPDHPSIELINIDACLDLFENVAAGSYLREVVFESVFERNIRAHQQTSVWVTGTAYTVSVWRVRSRDAASHVERIAALELFRDVRAHQHALFGVRYHAFCLELGILVVAFGMLLPRDGGLIFLCVDRWSGRLTRYDRFPSIRQLGGGTHRQLQRVFERVRAPVCALLFVETTLYILDRTRKLHTVQFTLDYKPIS